MIANSKMGGYCARPRIITAFLGIILSFVLIFSNFAGMYPMEVHADNVIVVDDVSDIYPGHGSNGFLSGNYILETDLDINVGSVHIDGDVSIDLNGHNIRPTIQVYDYQLTITSTNGGTVGGINVEPWDQRYSAGSVVVTGGTVAWAEVKDGSFTQQGGEVNLYNTGQSGTYTLSGGTLNADKIYNDGLLIQNGGTFTGSFRTNSEGTYTRTAGTTNIKIYFDANGGTGSMNPQNIPLNTATSISSNSFSYDGHTFTGWNTKADGSGTPYADGANITLSSPNAVTLYAQWETTPTSGYIIYLDPNGGNSNNSVTTGADGKLSSLPLASWTGHTLDGWFTAATGGTEITTDTVFSSSQTIYAHWRSTPIISYNVTFKVENGSWNSGSRDDIVVTLWRYENVDLALVLENNDIPLVGNSPDSGYSAGSWDTDPANANRLITEDKTFTYTYVSDGSLSTPSSGSPSNPSSGSSSTPSSGSAPTVVYESEPEPPVNYMQEVEDKITEAINLGGIRVVRIEGYSALSYHVLEMLQENPDITLVSEFTYDGLDYKITIPGSAVELDPSIKWYGPKYLFPMFYMYGTDTLPAVQAYLNKYESPAS